MRGFELKILPIWCPICMTNDDSNDRNCIATANEFVKGQPGVYTDCRCCLGNDQCHKKQWYSVCLLFISSDEVPMLGIAAIFRYLVTAFHYCSVSQKHTLMVQLSGRTDATTAWSRKVTWSLITRLRTLQLPRSTISSHLNELFILTSLWNFVVCITGFSRSRCLPQCSWGCSSSELCCGACSEFPPQESSTSGGIRGFESGTIEGAKI